MILGTDGGLQDLGWAIAAPGSGGRRVDVLELGTLHQPRIAKLDKATCRAVRVGKQAELLLEVARRHRVAAIAAEEMSFAGNKFNMVLSVGLSFGCVRAVAAALGVPLLVVPPKLWQCAVLGREPGDRSAVDYDEVYGRLGSYVEGRAAEQLAAIPAGQRNHAADAACVSVFVALKPEQSTRIGGA